MLQTKEQGKNLQDQINEEEIGNLLEKEVRVMIVKMIQNLRSRMEVRIEKIQEMFDRASLVVQWLRICLPMQGTRV